MNSVNGDFLRFVFAIIIFGRGRYEMLGAVVLDSKDPMSCGESVKGDGEGGCLVVSQCGI
jgi:hypothetical protein